MSMFTGVITALVTPFDDNDKIDRDAVKKIIKWQVDNEISGIVVSGTTGESPNLSQDEFVEIIKIAKKILKGNIPLVAGVSSNSTNKAILQAKIAEESGADAVMITAPYYNKPTQKGIIEHFKLITQNINIPSIIYNIPGRTSVNIEIDTVVQIINECKNVVAMKEATDNIMRFAELSRISKDFSVLAGDDVLTLPSRVFGAKGTVSVMSNLLPDLVVELHKLCDQNQYDKARKLHNSFERLAKIMFVETNPIPVKYAMSLLGLCKNNLRLPLLPLDEKYRSLIREELEKFYDIE